MRTMPSAIDDSASKDGISPLYHCLMKNRRRNVNDGAENSVLEIERKPIFL
jgi:hypothetical protein